MIAAPATMPASTASVAGRTARLVPVMLPVPVPRLGAGTLTASDREPAWRDPEPRPRSETARGAPAPRLTRRRFFFDAPPSRPYISVERAAPPRTRRDPSAASMSDRRDHREFRTARRLGRSLSLSDRARPRTAALPEDARTAANKVQGCASQVWVSTEIAPDGTAGPVLSFVGDSDAHIVRGLIAVLFALYSGKPARDILSLDAVALFERLGLREHLTPQRSNGFRSMVDRIRRDAQGAIVGAA